MFSTPAMVELRRSDEERQEAGTPQPFNASEYPYGLAISLDDLTLKKLDVDFDGIELGETYHLFVLAKVTAKSRHENENSGQRECVELQITHMGAESEDAENEEADKESLRTKLYKKK